jgi:hypothetical protein
VKLPDFPVDEETLGLLSIALDPASHGIPAECSSVGSFLEFMSQLGGSDISAVTEELDGVAVMRDAAYHQHDVIRSLVAEVRRLRAATP